VTTDIKRNPERGAPSVAFPIIDIHTHLMPERLFTAVRAYFRANLWHPRYDGPAEELVQALLASGVSRFVFMPYAHRADMSRSLNHWVANVQTTFAPHGIGFGTFHPDDDALIPELVEEAFVRLGLRGAKLHPQVGRFGLDDARLDPLYERAVQLGALLIVHAGRRPEPNEFVGARVFARVMRRFPHLNVIVAHAGADEFDAFFDLCGLYDGVYLDTAMVFNKFLGGPPPIQRVLEFQDRVVYGSDFPHIPYRVESSIQSILDLRLGRTLEEKILCTNAARLLRLDPAALAPTSAAR
jgi:predicted TIM-barrel fold metal-dependent hydrolase